MSARHVLFMCLALSACKDSKENSQTQSPSTSNGGTGGQSSGDASAQNGNANDSGSDAAIASPDDMITPDPDERTPDRMQADARLENFVRQRLIDCGIISDPKLPVGLDRIRDDHGRCFGRCFLPRSVPCVEIWQALCGIGESATLSACLDYCDTVPEDGFMCKSGDRIPHIFVCDQATDCPDGDDEGSRCASHACANGEALEHVGDIVCDAQQDCSDGSDETGCGYDCKTEPKPECTVTGSIRCDGTVDCTDGSDERDCRDVVCDGGFNVVDAAQVCDGDKDCFDGADEKNCP